MKEYEIKMMQTSVKNWYICKANALETLQT